VHEHIVTNWEGCFTIGPQINRILEKGLPTFPHLHSLTVEVAMDWYDKIQKLLMIYLIPVTPLDCVMLKMGYEALCIPGTGTSHYLAAARVLMELLPRLLLRSDTEVNSLINMVHTESGNGYDLLWQILELTVPGFDPANPIKLPIWLDEDIFGFAQAFLLYFHLQSKKGVYYDDQTRSTSFLQSIKESAYVDTITMLLTCINNYYYPNDDGYLPSNLCIMGLAHQLHKTAKVRVRSILPRANRTNGNHYDDRHFNVPIQGTPHCIYRLDGGRDAGGRDRPPYRDDRRRDDRGGRQQFPPRSSPPGGLSFAARPTGTNAPRGCFVRPDRNGRKWDPSLVCNACRCSGYIASQCDMLAMAIFIEKYKKNASNNFKDKIETAWLEKWKGNLGNPTRNP
jgi:hypothetical protein